MKKRKLADLGYQTTASGTERNRLSPQYLISKERLTRGRLLKDSGDSSNNWRYVLRSNKENLKGSGNGKMKKRKLPDHGNERRTRGRLLKDIGKSSNKRRYDLRSNKDHRLRVYQLKCGRDCFPLLDYHCSLANDIATKYEKVKHFLSGTERAVVLPNILQTQDLLFTVVTNGEIKEDLPLILRKQNLDNIKYADITEKSYVSHKIQEAKGSSCCLVIEHSGVNLDIQAADILRVSSQTPNKAPCKKDDREMVSDMTEQDIRRTLTHFLCKPLFSYADQIALRLNKPSNATSASPDLDGLFEQATQAAHALLNRKYTSRSSRSPETGRIPDKVAVELNKLAADGVLAFGFFSTGMMVFVDGNITEQRRRRHVEEKVKLACDSIDKSPRVEFTSRSFLRPTSIKQGGTLKNRTTGMSGTLGMVTRAQDRRGQVDEQDTVVALTSGHYFEEGNIAVGYIDKQNQKETDLGRCVASLPKHDFAAIKISKSDGISFNFHDQHDRLCNCVPVKQEMRIHNIVYKRGANTGLTKGYIRSPDFQINGSGDDTPLCNPAKGYLIQGCENRSFAGEGDSGSVVFFPDLEDEETVQIVSIQSSVFKEELAATLKIPSNVSYTVRADRCFETLHAEKGIEINLPTKQDMG
ncbi:uncharacterized protein LOC110441221 isoform X2 [Mizuhopecten yessoensis]|uniref:uncharacterized protein LOC110441221 isoform X2 n=1 Tax=Mizuhopecten yessoensis TaxID=6573 RepID=UPI000B45DA07|nr:uncharacterized protein LOC110441221 isoform X2 [Mizuhopecten yessoensis]